ncbi:Beta-galactosidase 6, partial [Perkinsus olseni]
STYRLPPGVLVSGQNTLAIFSATGHWVPAQGSPPVVVEKSYRQWTGVSVEPVEMFSCRFCSESPFARLFGEDPPPQASTPQGVQGRDSGGTSGLCRVMMGQALCQEGRQADRRGDRHRALLDGVPKR